MEEIKKKLGDCFKRSSVIFAYLFGSVAEGKEGVLSDIDIAVYFDEKVDYFDEKVKLLGEIMNILRKDDIDIVVLNISPPLISHRIVKFGKLIYSKDEKKRIEYEVRSVLRYLDWKPFLMKYTKEVFG